MKVQMARPNAALPPPPISGWHDAVGEYRAAGAAHLTAMRIYLGAAAGPSDAGPLVSAALALAELATAAGLADAAAAARQLANMAGICLEVGGGRGKRMLRLLIDRATFEVAAPSEEDEYAAGFANAA